MTDQRGDAVPDDDPDAPSTIGSTDPGDDHLDPLQAALIGVLDAGRRLLDLMESAVRNPDATREFVGFLGDLLRSATASPASHHPDDGPGVEDIEVR